MKNMGMSLISINFFETGEESRPIGDPFGNVPFFLFYCYQDAVDKLLYDAVPCCGHAEAHHHQLLSGNDHGILVLVAFGRTNVSGQGSGQVFFRVVCFAVLKIIK